MTTSTVECVSPTRAKLLLEKYGDPRKRSVGEATTVKWRRAMATGRWLLSGVMEVGDNDIFISAHHRLFALASLSPDDLRRAKQIGIKNGRPCHAYVDDDGQGEPGILFNFLWGVDPSARMISDTNRTKRITDVLKMQDATGTGVSEEAVSAISRRIWLWHQGYRTLRGATKLQPDADEIMTMIEADPSIEGAAMRGRDLAYSREGKCGAQGVNGFAYWLFHHSDPDVAETMWTVLLTGETGAETEGTAHAFIAARNRLIQGRTSRDRGAKLAPDEVLYILIRAWNAFLEESTKLTSSNIMTRSRDGVTSSTMPTPTGLSLPTRAFALPAWEDS